MVSEGLKALLGNPFATLKGQRGQLKALLRLVELHFVPLFLSQRLQWRSRYTNRGCLVHSCQGPQTSGLKDLSESSTRFFSELTATYLSTE